MTQTAFNLLLQAAQNDPRVFIRIGNFEVRWYGLIIAVGALVAAFIAARLAKRKGIATEHIWNIFPWVLVGGILGARLSFALVAPAGTFASPLDALNPFSGGFSGLTIQGGLVGGFLAAYIYCRINRISVLALADAAMPGVAVAQAIGRLGNFANQEAYGAPCTQGEWWCIHIDQDFRREPYKSQGLAFYQPTFAYELIWNLLNAAILFWLIQPRQQKRFGLRNGDLLWIYLIFYSIGRFVIEGIRIDSQKLAEFKAPQVVAIITIVIAVLALILSHTVFARRDRALATADGSTVADLDDSKMVDTTDEDDDVADGRLEQETVVVSRDEDDPPAIATQADEEEQRSS